MHLSDSVKHFNDQTDFIKSFQASIAPKALNSLLYEKVIVSLKIVIFLALAFACLIDV